MTFKKKAVSMAIAFGATFTVIMLSLISVFALSSLTGQKANVFVSYTVVPPEGVTDTYYEGKVSLYYKLAGDSDYTLLDGGANFNKNDVEPSSYTTNSITDEEIELTAEHTYFILCWKIENSTENSVNYNRKNFSVTLDYVDTDETDAKVNIRYDTRSQSLTSANNASYPYLEPKFTADGNISTSKSLGNLTYVSNASINVGYAHFFYVKVTIADKYQDAVFNGDFTLTITEAT